MFGCAKQQSHEVSFYHWKTNFSPSDYSKKYMDTLGVKKLYVKFFDVKWIASENRAYPFAQLKRSTTDSLPYNIIPTIYITNESILKTSDQSIRYLARDVFHKIKSIARDNHINEKQVSEFQIDCDWTLKTQVKYFAFLTELKTLLTASDQFSNTPISATIRLHQIKYAEKTGVPPADKGVLMFYNIGELTDKSTSNSILDISTAKKYMVNFDKYPLQLNVGLPLFCWGIQFRNEKVVQVINNLSSAQIVNNKNIEQIKPNYYRVTKNCYLNNQFIYKGDEIRLESIALEQLEEAKELIDEHIKNKTYEIIFYHLDEEVISNYPAQSIKAL